MQIAHKLGGAVATMGLVVAVACSRNANQNNFIGKSCQAESECPPELLCVQGACWEPCGADGSCPNATEACVLGACVPGGATGGGTDGGGGTQADGGGTSSGGAAGQSDGTVVRAGLPSEASAFATDDSRVVYLTKETDGFGKTTNVIHSAALAGTEAPLTIATLDVGPSVFAATNGYVYWIKEDPGAPPTDHVMRARTDQNTPTAETILSFPSSGGGGTNLRVVGTDVLFLDGSKPPNVRRYDAAASTLDPTTYGPAVTPPNGTFGEAEGAIWFLTGSGPYGVSKAPIGGAATDLGVSIPNGTTVLDLVGSGTTAYIAVFTAPGVNVLRLASGAAPVTVYSAKELNADPGGSSRPFAFDGAYAYVAEESTGGPTGDLVRLTLADGSKTTVGHYNAFGGVRPLTVTADWVYVLEGGQTGPQISRWAKPK